MTETHALAAFLLVSILVVAVEMIAATPWIAAWLEGRPVGGRQARVTGTARSGRMGGMIFTALDWFEVRSRGWCAVIGGIPELDPRGLTGRPVEIDGKRYTVQGVETKGVNPTGKPFSLLVGER